MVSNTSPGFALYVSQSVRNENNPQITIQENLFEMDISDSVHFPQKIEYLQCMLLLHSKSPS